MYEKSCQDKDCVTKNGHQCVKSIRLRQRQPAPLGFFLGITHGRFCSRQWPAGLSATVPLVRSTLLLLALLALLAALMAALRVAGETALGVARLIVRPVDELRATVLALDDLVLVLHL